MLETLVSDWIEIDVPADGHYAAIADVHGRADLLEEMLRQLDRDLPPDATVVFLGDLIDRGDRSIRSIDLAMGGIGERRTLAVAGNHESMLLYAIGDHGDEEGAASAMFMWYHNGGIEVLDELDIAADPGDIRAALGPARLRFLRSMLPHYLAGGVLFSHAGIDPGLPLAGQLSQPVLDFDRYLEEAGRGDVSMRWVRNAWVGVQGPVEDDLLVVYGHCVQTKGSPLLTPCQTGIDLGAFEYGVLCSAEIERGRMRFRYVGERFDPGLADPRNYVLSPDEMESYLEEIEITRD